MKQLLIKQFEIMDKMKIFEIDIAEALGLSENEYYLFHLNVDKRYKCRCSYECWILPTR